MAVGTSCVFSVGWELIFAELFVFAPGVPTAPTGVERESCGSSMGGNGKEHEVGLGLGLGMRRGLVAESLTVISLLEKSK